MVSITPKVGKAQTVTSRIWPGNQQDGGVEGQAMHLDLLGRRVGQDRQAQNRVHKGSYDRTT